jgi:TPR repeat protein
VTISRTERTAWKARSRLKVGNDGLAKLFSKWVETEAKRMSQALKATLVVLSLLCGAAEPVVAEPFEEGFKAFEGGNYPTAMRLLRPLAAEGDAKAQYNVGVMYEEGLGVSIDYTEAVGWLLQAAEQGHSEAKNHLGFLYLYGRGVSQDYVSAHMWFDLAASEGNARAVFARDLVAAKMTPLQVAEAQELARARKSK